MAKDIDFEVWMYCNATPEERSEMRREQYEETTDWWDYEDECSCSDPFNY